MLYYLNNILLLQTHIIIFYKNMHIYSIVHSVITALYTSSSTCIPLSPNGYLNFGKHI